MGETEKLDKAPKESWFTGLSAEFKDYLAGETITCKTDHSGYCCIRCIRSYHRAFGFRNSVWR